MQKIVVILGPTATGKSDLAVKIAKKVSAKGGPGAEIISADSRQVYRGLNIGTGKITLKEMSGIQHHLIDVANPRRKFAAADFVREGRRAIAAIARRGKLPIVCGGTGFYISALLGEITLSSIPPNQKLREKLAKKSAAELFATLQNIDPERALKIDRENPRRLIRAIEISLATTKNAGMLILSDRVNPKYGVLKIGLTLTPIELKKRIHTRLIARLEKGMIAEAKKLHKKGLSWKRMEELGLEYRYLARFLQTKITRDEMQKRLETEIWRYSKRQITWFKRDKEIKWFAPSDTKQIEKTILATFQISRKPPRGFLSRQK